jgi:transcription initiation factor IIE alpha subunit
MAIDEKLIERLLNESESETLDFKEEQYHFVNASDYEKSELLKDILAFVNGDRKSDAFILIGVREVKGGRSNPVGITQSIDDASLQQFVNNKTQKPVIFSYRELLYQSVKLGIIHIPVQKRPIFLTDDYGKLKKHDAPKRQGTSTVLASPDEIASMNRLREERTISGIAAKLLEYLVRDTNVRMDSMSEPDEIVIALNINLNECKDAIEELDSLGIVQTSKNMNSPIAYAHVRLNPSSFIQFVGKVLQDIDIVDEIKRTLSAFPSEGNDIFSETIFQSTKVPLVRLQRIIDFLYENNLIKINKGYLGEDKLRFMHGKLLPNGKRVLRGDDPLPVLNRYLV